MHLGPYRSKWHKLLSNALVASRPGLQLGAMSVTMALLLPGSVLMSVSCCHEGHEGHEDSWGLGNHLGLRWCLRAVLPLGTCKAGWPVLPHGAMVRSRPGLLQ